MGVGGALVGRADRQQQIARCQIENLVAHIYLGDAVVVEIGKAYHRGVVVTATIAYAAPHLCGAAGAIQFIGIKVVVDAGKHHQTVAIV